VRAALGINGASTVAALQAFLTTLRGLTPGDALQQLCDAGYDQLPMPGAGETLRRWQSLAAVAAHDLSLAKLFEGHTDALAILVELNSEIPQRSRWGTWAAEPPQARVHLQHRSDGSLTLSGRKAWCSGAAAVTHGLLTAWLADENGDDHGPLLVAVDMRQPNVHIAEDGWNAVGMAASASVEVRFDNAVGRMVGASGDYLCRAGFWHGGAGIAACWYGAAAALAEPLRARVAKGAVPHAAAHLGTVDVALQQCAALLRQTADRIDRHPRADAQLHAMRARASAECTATLVLDHVGRALGAAPFCLDADFARRAADLPVYLRQSHAERDLQAIAEVLVKSADAAPLHSVWAL
jgi:hypothetical protein